MLNYPGKSFLAGLCTIQTANPLPDMPIMGSSNSAANKNMMSKTWTNEVQLFDSVENIVGKEEIARNEQFLLFPQCFQKLSFVHVSK